MGIFGSIILLTLGTAALAHFFQLTMEKGMIFRPYAYLIKYYFDFKPRKRKRVVEAQTVEVRPGIYGFTNIRVLENNQKWYSWFYKPLGGCIYCNSVWILIGYFIIFNLLYLHLHWLHALFWLPLAIGLQYLWLKASERYLL